MGFQQRYISYYRLPDDVQIERKIFMGDIVSEAGNRVPGDIGITPLEDRRKSRGCFTNHKQLMEKTTL